LDPVPRRRFLLAAGALLAARGVRAQAPHGGKPFRIGQLPDSQGANLQMLKDALGAAGWLEERDYVLVNSGVSFTQPMAPGARHLVEQKVDLIIVSTTAHALAARRATASIPIVMRSCGYPVEAGVANSLARPGKNVTGMTLYAGTGIWGKLLDLLRESQPGIRRVAVAWGYVPPVFPRAEIEPCYEELQSGARELGLSLHVEEIARPERVEAALASIDARAPDALLVTAGPGIWDERQRVMAYAVRKRLPSIADFLWLLDIEKVTPLFTYGASFVELTRQAAVYVVRILAGGAQPGELPIQQPAKLELVVNLRTARAIALEVPRSILLRADRVIE
jgi:putative ABC transport system substrate-binding protein